MATDRDYIPPNDRDFDIWQSQFSDFALAHAAELGLTPENQARLSAARDGWTAAFPAHRAARTAARQATKAKNGARTEYKRVARLLAQMIQTRLTTTDQHRKGLGITVPDRERTRLERDVIDSTRAPVLVAKCIAGALVMLRWKPVKRPFGVRRVNVFAAEVKEGEEPFFVDVGSSTRARFIHQVGNRKTVTMLYKVRWVDRLDRPGAFCDDVEVAVTAQHDLEPTSTPSPAESG